MSRDCTQGAKCYNCKSLNPSLFLSHDLYDFQAVISVTFRATALKRCRLSVYATSANNLATYSLRALTKKAQAQKSGWSRNDGWV
jgi:hypothetical protein